MPPQSQNSNYRAIFPSQGLNPSLPWKAGGVKPGRGRLGSLVLKCFVLLLQTSGTELGAAPAPAPNFFSLMPARRLPGRAEGCTSALLVHTLYSSSPCFPSCFPSHPCPKPHANLWLAAHLSTNPAVGLVQFLYDFYFFFPYRNIRDKHNNFQEAKASPWRSQRGPGAESWYGVAVTLIPSDTWVSPKPSHCVLQMYINISMHWHNMDPLFQMLMRTRCCLGAAAAF